MTTIVLRAVSVSLISGQSLAKALVIVTKTCLAVIRDFNRYMDAAHKIPPQS